MIPIGIKDTQTTIGMMHERPQGFSTLFLGLGIDTSTPWLGTTMFTTPTAFNNSEPEETLKDE